MEVEIIYITGLYGTIVV